MFDAKTRGAVCVIDLDTVMPGSALYDFGDAMRIGASTAAEDETNLDLVGFDVEKFTAFTKGYAEEAARITTEKYNLGKTDFTSWNTAMTELSKAKYALSNTTYKNEMADKKSSNIIRYL